MKTNIGNQVILQIYLKFQISQFFSFFLSIFARFLVVLLDTTKEATLEWTRYPYGPQAQTPGVRMIADKHERFSSMR